MMKVDKSSLSKFTTNVSPRLLVLGRSIWFPLGLRVDTVVVCLICLVDIGWYLAGKEETIWVKFEFD